MMVVIYGVKRTLADGRGRRPEASGTRESRLSARRDTLRAGKTGRPRGVDARCIR
jgi:hypothetical protein